MKFMSEEKKEHVDAFMDEQTNWKARCQKCGQAFVGTKAALGLAMAKHDKEGHGV